MKEFIVSLLQKEKLPLQDEKYAIDRATVWCELEKVYRGCTNFARKERMPLQEAAQILARRQDRFSRDVQVVNLRVSQATALEEFDQRLAAKLEGDVESLQSEIMPVNDATNACAFLSIGVAESILYESETEEFFENLPKAVELTILSLPEGINEHRDLGKTYDA